VKRLALLAPEKGFQFIYFVVHCVVQFWLFDLLPESIDAELAIV
jgi:hypothetical protein